MARNKTKWTFPELDQRLIKRGLLGAFALFIALLFIYALMPSPVLVDTEVIGPQTRIDTGVNGENGFVEVFAPENGRVLKIQTESEQVVRPGEALLEIGDPNDLEIVVDLLSTDAVKVKQGAQAHVEGWGGGTELAAKVRRIDPAGFTKISALGIEEQRVNTILDLVDLRENWQQLGHNFRVFVRVIVWKSDNVLQVPLSALFRSGDDWAVFKFEDGRAKLTPIKIGQRNSKHAEIIEGLDARDRVILHPSDRVADGVGVEERDQNRTSPSI